MPVGIRITLILLYLWLVSFSTPPLNFWMCANTHSKTSVAWGRSMCVWGNHRWTWDNIGILRMLSSRLDLTHVNVLYPRVLYLSSSLSGTCVDDVLQIDMLQIRLQSPFPWKLRIRWRLLSTPCPWAFGDWYGRFFYAIALCWCRFYDHLQTLHISSRESREWTSTLPFDNER